MATPLDIASDHLTRSTQITDRAVRRALRVFRQIDPQALDLGWALHGGTITRIGVAAQTRIAAQADTYLNQIAPSDVRVVPEAFSGVTLDGRELQPALFGAVATTKTLTSRVGAERAFEVGASFLATVMGAAISDMGRQADMVGAVGRRFTRYIRVLSPGACSRCAILAGKGEYSQPFLRHPRCKCQSFPITSDTDSPVGFFDNANDYFESLSRAEQDRIFTKAGAEAHRQGASLQSVVNARRGAYGIGYSGHYNTPVAGNRLQPLTIGVRADGTPLRVYATTEGTTRRGQFGRDNFTGSGRRTTTVRLMPEQISVMAGGSPDRWLELLRKYGYIDPSSPLR